MDRDPLLVAYEKALRNIAADYPNASREFKLNSIVKGAGELARAIVSDWPFEDQLTFAKELDEIRDRVFKL